MLKKVEWLEVVSVEPDGVKECVCISVADPSKLYATGQGILTHNTTVKGMRKEYVAVTAATGELRAGMKLVKSAADERTIDGVRVADTQYKTRSFEDMAPLAEAVIDSWHQAQLGSDDILDLLRTGEHEESGQSLEGGERILLINSLFGTGRFRDFGILQSDLSRVVQELTGDAGFILRGVQEFLDPIAKMKAEADAQTGAEVKKVTGSTTEELISDLERETHAEQLAELQAALVELRKQNGALAASIQEAAAERLARAEEVARLRNLLKLEEKRSKELAARPDSKEEADQRLAEELVKSRAKIRELTKKLAEAEGLFARSSEGPSATRAMETFNLWIMGGVVRGVPPLEVLASQYIKMSRFDRDGLRDGIRRLFPMLNTNVLDDALDRIVAELEGSREVEAEAEEPSPEVEREVEDLRSQLADERGKLVAVTSTWEKILAVFRAAGGRKSKTLGSIAKGAAAAREAAKARMAARAKEGRVNSLPVEDLADSAIIGASFFAEGVVNLTDWSQAMIREIGERVRPHLSAIFAESSKLYLEDVEREAAKPQEPRVKKEPKAPKLTLATVNDRAQKIINRLAADFSDTPTWPGPKTPDALRALVNEAMSAKEEMADLGERAKTLGVSDEVAAQLVTMVLEARRRKEVVNKAKKASRLAEARQRAITRLIDKLEGKVKPKNHENLGKFLGSLKRASDWGILDKDVFSQAFAHAFNLNGLTPARVQQLHTLWHQLRNSGAYGMVRETLERQFLDAVNAVAPAARWDNALFSAFMSKVLSSLSSVVNQFDGITRILSPLTAVTNALYTGDPAAAFGNYASGLSRLATGLPFWLTGAKGESLGHLPSEIGNGFKPGEQQLSRTTGVFRVRLPGGRVVQLSPTTTQILRWMELYSWRLIRGAEGLVGSAVDARSSYQDALTQHYRSTGMKPAAARKQALRDIAAGPADIAAAKAQAQQEQASGLIGAGEHVLKRRAEEIIQRLIDQRLGADIVKQAEHFTAYMNFKTDPVGPFGHLATQIVKGFIPTDKNGQAQSYGRLTRFWLMFPRFFGNLVDRSVGYIPGLHLINHAVTSGNRGTEANIIEIFGSVENYRRYNNARAGSGAAVMVMAAALIAVSKALRDDEDEEPWFDITGSLPSSNREQKARLKASGKWTETTLKIGPLRLNYASFGELSPVLTMIGNANDYLTHGEASGFDGVAGAGYQLVADTAAAPVRRSTYKQWLQLVSNISGGANAQQGEAGLRNAYNLLTQPLGAVLKVPLVTDLDRLYRGDEVRVASTLGEKVLSKVPFVKVGNALITPYGERVQGMPFLGLLGDNPTSDSDITRAARLNLDTNTIRNVAQVPDAIESDAEGLAFQELAGKLYVSGMVKNEATIRAKLESGDLEEAQWIIRTIAAMANASAKSQTWPELYGKDAKAEAAKAAAEERRVNKRERGPSYVLPP